MISHQYKCIFVHIIKTGGTTIEGWLQNCDQWNLQSNMKHITARKAKLEYAEYWDDYFKFSFIRNPYDRILSELNSGVSGMFYNYLKLNQNQNEKLLDMDVHRFYDVHCNGGALINDFDEWNMPDFQSTKGFYKNINFGLDKVYKYEEWNNACEEISQILGLDSYPKMIEGGISTGFAYDRKYTVEDLRPSDIELINTIHDQDFETYGYERKHV